VAEVASGKTLSGRPLLREALDRLDRGEAQALIVTKVDRVARNTVDVLNLAARADKNGWVLVILNLDLDTSTPTGRLVLTILAAVAGMESALIGERAMDTHAARRAVGVRRGRKVSIPEATRQRIALERASGLSLQAIANGLTADGVPTRNAGANWHPSTVSRVLDSLRIDAEMVSIREALEVAA
jgi:DNA invertase Pin-like site-specific DNA recombinase